MKVLKYYLRELVKFMYLILCKDFKRKNKESVHNVLVSYITEPFFRKNDISYMNKHQNRYETLIMADVFDSLGYSYQFTRLDKPHLSLKGYDVVFGVEPNFMRACSQNNQALKIYYATGAYCLHQNKVIRHRTDEFNEKNKSSVPYYRLVDEHNSCELADYIIQIGSHFTLQSYPENIRSKIRIIRQSCHDFKFKDFIGRKIKKRSEKSFVWMGSAGSILKGFDLVVDYFLQHPELDVHILGTVDSEVMDVYKSRIDSAHNVHLHGFIDLDSEKLEKIALEASAVIMPSASEGGCPGSVINMMKLGCVPIVSDYSAFDGIEDYGILVSDYSVKSIELAISEFLSWSAEELDEKIIANYEFANTNFNKQIFKSDFENCITEIVKEHDAKL